MATQSPQEPASPTGEKPVAALRMRWDDTSAKASFPTMCQVASAREQVTLSFGITQDWKAGQQEIPVQLTDRIVLSPHSARQLTMLLIKALREYDARFRPAQTPGA